MDRVASLYQTPILLITRYYVHFARFLAELLGQRLAASFQKQILAEQPQAPEKSPRELLDERLNQDDYEGALAIAQQHDLNPDIVYQLQWINCLAITSDSIGRLLSPVSDRNWQIEQCCNRLASSFDASKELIELGLRHTELKEVLAFDPDDIKLEDLENLSYDEYIEKVQTRINEQRKEMISQAQNNLTEAQRQQILARLRLLCYYEKLHIYKLILEYGDVNSALGLHYDANDYERFRNQSYLEAAINLAQEGDWKAVRVLFTYAGDHTLPHRLVILSHFPETMSPLNYKSLLPHCSPHKDEEYSYRWEEIQVHTTVQSDAWPVNVPDWSTVHFSHLAQTLHGTDQESEYADRFYAQYHQSECDIFKHNHHTKEISRAQLSCWFAHRAREIEQLSSLIFNSLTLLTIGIKSNVPDLEQLRDELEIYQKLVYEVFPHNPSQEVDFSSFQKLSMRQKVNLLMCNALESEQAFNESLQDYLLPFLEKSANQPMLLQPLLYDYLLCIADSDLTFCKQFIATCNRPAMSTSVTTAQPLSTLSSSPPDASLKLFTILSSKDFLLKVGIDSIYACKDVSQLQLAKELLQVLPAETASDDTHLQELYERKQQLQNHLIVAQLLAKHQCYLPVAEIRQHIGDKNIDLIRNLFVKIIKRSAKLHLSNQQWMQILDDMREIRASCFDVFISEQELMILYIKSLLSSNHIDNIHLAASFLQLQPEPSVRITDTEHILNSPRNLAKTSFSHNFSIGATAELDSKRFPTLLNLAQAVDLLVTVANDYISSANSINDKIIDRAIDCLSLIKQTDSAELDEKVQKELDFIAALRLLNQHFDLKLLPIQIRLIPYPRLDILINAARSIHKGYRNIGLLIELARFLRVFEGKSEQYRNAQVLTFIGDLALQEKDYKFCHEVCQQLIKDENSYGWELCYRLAMLPELSNREVKYDLLSFALTHCEEDGAQINLLIEEIKKVKVELNENRTDDTISKLIINKTQDVSGLILNKTQDVALATAHLTGWLLKNISKQDDEDSRIASQYHAYELELEQEEELKRKLMIDSINVPTFHYDAFQSFTKFPVKVNQLDLDYRQYVLPNIRAQSEPFPMAQLILRTSLLSKSEQLPVHEHKKIDELLKELTYSGLFHDTSLALSYIFSLGRVSSIEEIFDKLNTKSSALVYIALYVCSLLLCKRIDKDFDVEANSMEAVIQIAEEHLDNGDAQLASQKLCNLIQKYRYMYDELNKANNLLALYPDIDVNRFVNDDLYKRETLLGLAMTDDEQALANVTSLAVEYSISLFDIYQSYVENLLTFVQLPAAELELRIFKNIELHSALVERYEETTKIFEERIYPLIDGCELEKLCLYYKILMEINSRTKERKEVRRAFGKHYRRLRDLVKECQITGIPVDYKRLTPI